MSSGIALRCVCLQSGVCTAVEFSQIYVNTPLLIHRGTYVYASLWIPQRCVRHLGGEFATEDSTAVHIRVYAPLWINPQQCIYAPLWINPQQCIYAPLWINPQQCLYAPLWINPQQCLYVPLWNPLSKQNKIWEFSTANYRCRICQEKSIFCTVKTLKEKKFCSISL